MNKFRNWEMMFPPRLPLHWHPLMELVTGCRDTVDPGVVATTTMGPATIATNANTCMANLLRFGNCGIFK